MKKGLFLLASIAMLMLAGCGESGGATSANAGNPAGSASSVDVDVPSTVGAQEVAVTTPRNLYNISDKLGTPPALPGK